MPPNPSEKTTGLCQVCWSFLAHKISGAVLPVQSNSQLKPVENFLIGRLNWFLDHRNARDVSEVSEKLHSSLGEVEIKPHIWGHLIDCIVQHEKIILNTLQTWEHPKPGLLKAQHEHESSAWFPLVSLSHDLTLDFYLHCSLSCYSRHGKHSLLCSSTGQRKQEETNFEHQN